LQYLAATEMLVRHAVSHWVIECNKV